VIGAQPVTGVSLTADAALFSLRSGLACLAGNGVADTDVVAQWTQESGLRQAAISTGAAFRATGLACVGGASPMAASQPDTPPAPGAAASVAIGLAIALPSLPPAAAAARRQLDASTVLGPLLTPTPGARLTAWQAKALAVLVALSAALSAPATVTVGAPSPYAAELGQPLSSATGGYWLSTQADPRGFWPAVAARPLCLVVGGAGGTSACFSPSDVAALTAALASSSSGGAAAASGGGGAVVGAAAGGALVLLLAGAVTVVLVRRRRRQAGAQRHMGAKSAAGGGGKEPLPLATANPMMGAAPSSPNLGSTLHASPLLQAAPPQALAANSLREMRMPAFALAGGGGDAESSPASPLRDERGRVAFAAVGSAHRASAPAAAGFGATPALAAARLRVSSRNLSKGAAPPAAAAAPPPPKVNAAGIVVDAVASRPGEENAMVGLPEGWTAVWSQSRKTFYWRNMTSGETTWEKPI